MTTKPPNRMARPVPAALPATELERTAGKKFPHRVSVDLDDATYQALFLEASRRTMANGKRVTLVEIVRELLTQHVPRQP